MRPEYPTASQSHMALRPGCKVGGSRHATVLSQDPELRPLLCGEQRCHGVTMFLCFLRLAAAPGQPRQFLPELFLCSDR